ncbi:unnamed protein product [Linum tenue]|uniref:F-box domain-containing protein n=1 Tax=Linum tenue TaxID=586396 RepID=A0AAV0R4X0_9ROSI|nr:unnamed protein product [Linum tenue]
MSSICSFTEQIVEEDKGDDPEAVAAGYSVFTGKEPEGLQGEGSSSSNSCLDRISGLPDEIHVKILSALALEEAVRTAVLSNRWKDLWKSAVTILDFEAPTKLEQIQDIFGTPREELQRLQEEHRRWFIDWVNGVVTQLQEHNSCAPKLSKFRVCFNLCKACNYRGDIDEWLEFAISKGVEYLELSFNLDYELGTWDRKCYRFSQDCFRHIKTPTGLANIKSLRSLRLCYVDVKGELLQHLISNCPLLEELVVHKSSLLRTLKVVGSLTSPIPLKHLELTHCQHLQSLEIDHAPHLAHLTREGHQGVELRVDNCARLVDVNFVCQSIPGSMIQSFCRYAGQLESLTLELSYGGLSFPDVGELHLKWLTLRLHASKDDSMLGMIPLIDACPRLQKLTVKLHTDTGNQCRRYRHVKKCRESIKVVEIVGFSGYHVDCEFVDYVLEHYVGLETIVIDRGLTTPFKGRLTNYCSEEQANIARKLALELKSKASRSVEFVVI